MFIKYTTDQFDMNVITLILNQSELADLYSLFGTYAHDENRGRIESELCGKLHDWRSSMARIYTTTSRFIVVFKGGDYRRFVSVIGYLYRNSKGHDRGERKMINDLYYFISADHL
jgi:hypothetical protein